MNDEVKEFCRKYEARVRPSTRHWNRIKPVPYPVFEEQGFDAFATRDYVTVPMVDITLPEDRFRALLEHDEWINQAGLHDNSYFNNNVGRVANLVVEHERECRIRHENPAVRAAYEKYRNLLTLVDSHYK